MDELIKMTCKQFALAQRMCELEAELGNVRREYDEIASKICQIREDMSTNDRKAVKET